MVSLELGTSQNFLGAPIPEINFYPKLLDKQSGNQYNEK